MSVHPENPDRLELAVWPLRMLSWQRRRDLSITLRDELEPVAGFEKAYELARRICGVIPDELLTVTETMFKLRRMGVKKARSSLYRLAKKVPRFNAMTVYMNAKGCWDGAPSAVANPVAKVRVFRGKAIHFKVERL